MIKNLAFNKTLYLLTGVLSLVAAVAGVLDTGMYGPVVSARIMPGVFTQDLLVILGSLVMVGLAARMRSDDYRKAITIFGILGFLFYAYGIYAMEQLYTALYPLYLAILALSFYALAYGLASLERSAIEGLELPSILRYAAAGYGVFIAVMFNFIWIGQLIPLLQRGDRIEYTFSIFIIDLVFIMPAFVIAAVLAVRKRALGVVGLPALFIVGVGILSPLALAELLKPVRYGLAVDPGEFWLYAVLSLVFLVFAAVYLIALKPSRPSGA
jgi:hypothetical protein